MEGSEQKVGNAHFEKTRLVYFANKNSLLKPGNYTNFKITNDSNDTMGDYRDTEYACVSVPGVNGHNWHYIPNNHFGLYMTPAEIQTLVRNSRSIKPIRISVIVSNLVPLATYPNSGSTTQLSFNNTIYALIYHNRRNYTKVDYENGEFSFKPKDILEFCRTYDGENNFGATAKRLDLPLQNFIFKIPKHRQYFVGDTNNIDMAGRYDDPGTHGQFQYIVTNSGSYTSEDSVTSVIPTAANQPRDKTINLLQKDLIDAYIAEFLQDTDNVYQLYPGENMAVFDYYDDENPLAHIPVDGPNMTQSLMMRDKRLQNTVNTSATVPFEDMLSIPVFPQYFGEGDFSMWSGTDQFRKKLGAFAKAAAFDATANKELSIELCKLYETMFALWERLSHGDSPSKYITKPITETWIKGNPIIDASGNLVNHSFQATVTWKIDFDVEANLLTRASKLQWAMTNKQLVKYAKAINGTGTNAKYVYRYATRHFYDTPVKPMNASMESSCDYYYHNNHYFTGSYADSQRYNPIFNTPTNYEQRDTICSVDDFIPMCNVKGEVANIMLVKPACRPNYHKYKETLTTTNNVTKDGFTRSGTSFRQMETE